MNVRLGPITVIGMLYVQTQLEVSNAVAAPVGLEMVSNVQVSLSHCVRWFFICFLRLWSSVNLESNNFISNALFH